MHYIIQNVMTREIDHELQATSLEEARTESEEVFFVGDRADPHVTKSGTPSDPYYMVFLNEPMRCYAIMTADKAVAPLSQVFK